MDPPGGSAARATAEDSRELNTAGFSEEEELSALINKVKSAPAQPPDYVSAPPPSDAAQVPDKAPAHIHPNDKPTGSNVSPAKSIHASTDDEAAANNHNADNKVKDKKGLCGALDHLKGLFRPDRGNEHDKQLDEKECRKQLKAQAKGHSEELKAQDEQHRKDNERREKELEQKDEELITLRAKYAQAEEHLQASEEQCLQIKTELDKELKRKAPPDFKQSDLQPKMLKKMETKADYANAFSSFLQSTCGTTDLATLRQCSDETPNLDKIASLPLSSQGDLLLSSKSITHKLNDATRIRENPELLTDATKNQKLFKKGGWVYTQNPHANSTLSPLAKNYVSTPFGGLENKFRPTCMHTNLGAGFLGTYSFNVDGKGIGHLPRIARNGVVKLHDIESWEGDPYPTGTILTTGHYTKPDSYMGTDLHHFSWGDPMAPGYGGITEHSQVVLEQLVEERAGYLSKAISLPDSELCEDWVSYRRRLHDRMKLHEGRRRFNRIFTYVMQRCCQYRPTNNFSGMIRIRLATFGPTLRLKSSRYTPSTVQTEARRRIRLARMRRPVLPHCLAPPSSATTHARTALRAATMTPNFNPSSSKMMRRSRTT